MFTTHSNHLHNIFAGTVAGILATVLSIVLTVAVAHAGTSTEIFLEQIERVPANTVHITVKNNSLTQNETPICVQTPEQHLGCVPSMSIAGRTTAQFTIFVPDTVLLSELRLSYRDADGDWHEIIDPSTFETEYRSPYIFTESAVYSSDTITDFTREAPIGGNATLIPAAE